MSMVKNEDFKIIKGEDKLNTLSISLKNRKTLFLFELWNLHTSQSKSQSSYDRI